MGKRIDDSRTGAEEFLSTLGDESQDMQTQTGAAQRATFPELPVIGGSGDTTEDGDKSALSEEDERIYASLKARRAERRRKKLIRRGIICAVAVGLIAIAAGAIHLATREPKVSMEPVTEMVTRGTFTTRVEGKGTLKPRTATVVSPTIEGTIEQIFVSAGDDVQKGETLFTIKNDELDRAVDEAARGVRDAQAELTAAQRACDQAAGVSAEGEAMDTTSAQESVSAAQRAVEAAQATLNQAREQAALRTVTAPSAGSVVAMNAQVGAAIGGGAVVDSEGTSAPLMQIADLSKMKVSIEVSEEEIAQVALKQSGEVTFPAFEGLSLKGRVTGIASIASAGDSMGYEGSPTPVFPVDILIDKPDKRLKPGMTAEVMLTTKELNDVIMVPLTALMTDDGESYHVDVEIDPESHEVESRPVTVYAKNDDCAVVGRPADGSKKENPKMDVAPIDESDVLVIGGGTAGGSEEWVDDGSTGGGMAVM